MNLLDSAEFEWDVQSDGAIADGRHVPSNRGDAYDTFGELYVSTDDAVTYVEYVNPDDAGCAYEGEGREVVFPPGTSVPGVELRRKVFVPASGVPFARWIDSVTNTGATTITLRLRWGGNLGSDGSTSVSGTSSGDTVIDSADGWAGTGGGGDPAIAHLWGTTLPGAVDRADTVGAFRVSDPDAGADIGNLTAEYQDVAIAPGETIAYMHAEAMRLTDPEAVAAAQTLGVEPEELDVGISAEEAAQIRNWNVGDRERDGVPNAADNCPAAVNSDQADLDGDGPGDACDDDIDGDGRSNAIEEAVGTNPRSADTDGDGVRDVQDACPTVAGRGANGCPRFDEQQPPGNTTASADITSPRVTLPGVRRRIGRRELLRRGLGFKVGCSEACALRIELMGRVRRARISRAGELVLGARSLPRAEGARRARVKVARRLRRAVGRPARLTLRVTATDAAGNRRVARRVVRVR